ncbi:MAG: ABC transporter substrate-binding protein [Lachnospiraceae bacterium]|nr:ABC transporter substrate-binding protein [Lachnospiraceae bacterium]
MKKKLLAMMCSMALVCGLFGGCGITQTTTEETVETEAETEASADEETTDETAQAEADAETEDTSVEEEEEATLSDDTVIRIGSLSGPTTMGLVQLMEDSGNGESVGNYEFTIATAADEITTALVKGELDIILIPANAASTLYNKTEGGVTVLDINTLSVLYLVTGDETVNSIEDLSGRTVYLPSKGTTPDYALQYLLAGYGITDCTLEYKSESSEVAAILAEDSTAIGLLPQPFVTVACNQNEALRVAVDINEVWNTLQEQQGTDNALVTGVTIVRTEFLEEHEEAVLNFMAERKASAEEAVTDVEHTAELVAEAGIVGSAAIAEKAIPECNIVYIDGEEMKEKLSGYLEVLYSQSPDMVGGALPGDDFYYIAAE